MGRPRTFLSDNCSLPWCGDDDERALIDRVVEPLGVVLNNQNLAGEGCRYWFEGPNRGHPFDGALKRQVYQALAETSITRWLEQAHGIEVG